jgi:GT2 family glycosyltransferase
MRENNAINSEVDRRNDMQVFPDISVVICAYTLERWDKLTLAVASVRQQTYLAREIIVVIDHNFELFQLALHELVGVSVIENKEKQGLSGARNSGIGVASGSLIAFLDDDAVAGPEWLEQISLAMADPSFLGVGGVVQPDWEEREPLWFPAEFCWVVGCTYLGMPQMGAQIRNPIGANMCIRREVFQAIGGFRREIGRVGTLPVGCEETELCIRAGQYWPDRFFFYLPQANVTHFIPKKRSTWRYFCSRCYAEGCSKAVISRFVGTKDALASESRYILRALPLGFLRNISQVFTTGWLSGVARATAIVIGLSITVVGYLVGKYHIFKMSR